MKLHEFLQSLKGIQHKAAVYDELIAYLQKCIGDEVEIPVDIDDGFVPESYIHEVIADLKERRNELLEKLEVAEDVEVAGVDAGDFAHV